jgi:hypothetical protein
VRVADHHRLPFTVSSILKFLQLWSVHKGCPCGVFVHSCSRTKPCLAPISSCRSLAFVPFCVHPDQAQDSFVFLFPALLCLWSRLLRFGFPSLCTWHLDAVVQLRDHARMAPFSRFISFVRWFQSRFLDSVGASTDFCFSFSFLESCSPRPHWSAPSELFVSRLEQAPLDLVSFGRVLDFVAKSRSRLCVDS